MRPKVFLVTALVAALLVAGVASFYASSNPDGLEYVAEKTGFIDTAEDSPTSGGPFVDYSTEGVDNERVSVGVSGVVGALVTLTVAGGLFWLLRRRADEPGQVDHARDQADSEV